MDKSIIVAIFFGTFGLVCSSGMVPTHLFLKRLGPCSRTPRTIVSVSEFSITRARYNFSLNGVINVTADVPNEWRIKAKMQKCQDIRNLDTCDYYKSFPLISAGCSDDVSDERDLYALLFASALPSMSCPVKAGSYKIRGYPFVSKNNLLIVSESKISTSMFGYLYIIEGYNNEDEKIFCAEALLRLIYLREHELIDEVVDENTYRRHGESEGDSASTVNEGTEGTTDGGESE